MSADSRKLTAGIDEAKRSLKSLGIAASDATKGQSQSIDRYIKSLGVAAVTTGKTARELELYRLALHGASAEQLKAADSALKMTENAQKMTDAYAKGVAIGDTIKKSLFAVGAAATTGLIAAYVAFDQLTKKAGDFQDMAEKTGDTAENIASLAVAAGTAGIGMETIVSASAKLTKGLTGVDDESKAAGSALAALGLNIKDFKALAPADQMEAVAKALGDFEDGAQKTAVAMALFGKSGAELMPFLKELGAEGGRQVILTQAQIEQADAYADKQAKLRTELGLHASAIASQMVPAYNLFTESLIDVAKEMLGVEKGIAGMTRGNEIKDFANDGALLLANIADVAYDAAQAFHFVGANLIAMKNIAAANLRLDFAGAVALGAASDAQNEQILKGLGLADRVQAKIDAMGKNQSGSFIDPRRLGSVGTIAEQDAANNPKKKLNFNGATPADKTGKDTSGQEAKAQLGLDLESIKSVSESLINTYTNTEKMIEALHGSGLLKDRDYYAAKRDMLAANNTAQEDALVRELARLQQEGLTGKAKIDNDKKIVDVQAKLAKSRENAWASTSVLAVQEVAANKKIEQSYTDAKTAAQAYIETVMKQNSREIDGIGKGDSYRAKQSGLNAIEDKQTTQRQGLEGNLSRGQIDQTQFDTYLAIVNDTYAKEVAAYDARTSAIKEKQGDWLNGASEAFANYQSNAENVAGNSAAMFSTAFEGMTDGVASSISAAILQGKSLEDSLRSVAMNIADAFITSFIKMQIQKLFVDKTAATMYASTIALQSQAMVAMAGLAAFASTAAIPIVGPAAAPAAAAAAIAAAEGFAVAATAAASMSIASARGGFDIPGGVNPITQLHEKEMVLPQAQANVIRDLAKDGSGGGKSAPAPITIINQTSGRIDSVREQTLSNGERAIIIQEAVAATAAQMGDPNSKTSRSMSHNFNMQRSR